MEESDEKIKYEIIVYNGKHYIKDNTKISINDDANKDIIYGEFNWYVGEFDNQIHNDKFTTEEIHTVTNGKNILGDPYILNTYDNYTLLVEDETKNWILQNNVTKKILILIDKPVGLDGGGSSQPLPTPATLLPLVKPQKGITKRKRYIKNKISIKRKHKK